MKTQTQPTRTTKETSFVDVRDFSKDHWSLFGYIESRVHSHQVAPATGELNRDNLRINENGDYPILANNFGGYYSRQWKEEYGSRLVGYFLENNKFDTSKRLDQHDDINCLNDLENAGLIEVISLVNLFVKLTKRGQSVASELRAWKNSGKMYYNFVASEKALSTENEIE